MPPTPPPGPLDPATQFEQHLAALRGAGVEWLPAPRVAATARGVVASAGPGEPQRPSLRAAAGLPMAPAVQTGLFASGAAPAVPDDPDSRRRALAELAAQVAGCRRCSQLWSTRTQTVFGVGPIDAELGFVGEAPGQDEDRTGVPFVGAAGQLLDRILTACGLKREEVYICNILRCRPPGNRTPLPEEADHCREYLERQLALVRPKLLCALGATATRHLLGTTVGITRLRGKWLDYRGTPVMCTFHPSYLLRTPEAKKDVWEDMKAVLARMGRPIPGK